MGGRARIDIGGAMLLICLVACSDEAPFPAGALSNEGPQPDAAVDDMDAGRQQTVSMTAVASGSLRGTEKDVPADYVQAQALPVIAADWDYTCGIQVDGLASCWGIGEYGQLEVKPGDFVQISVGQTSVCALDRDGSLVCWGAGDPDNPTDTNLDLGQSDPPAGEFKEVAVGGAHACAIRERDDAILCWGAGRVDLNERPHFGQLFAPDGAYRSISSGTVTTCAIDLETDKPVCWGAGLEGVCDAYELDCTQANAPDIELQTLSVGYVFACGITMDDALVCWGLESNDNCFPETISERDVLPPYGCGMVSPPDGNYRQVNLGNHHACAIDLDNGVHCWGWNDYEMAFNPVGAWHQVAAGVRHSCGVRSDGNVFCWGMDAPASNVPDDFPL